MYEMVTVRYCLKQLSKCAFEDVVFNEIVFNPAMIKLLFDENKKFSLNIQNPILYATGYSFENIWKFSLNCVEISECLRIYFASISTEHFDIISNILTNEGKKLPKVNFRFNNPGQQFYLQLCDFIVQYITTSKDFTTMVPSITFMYSDPIKLKLSDRAENVETKRLGNKTITTYEIANIYNPKIRFLCCNQELFTESVFKIKIKTEKEQGWKYSDFVDSSYYNYLADYRRLGHGY
ncbi:unnamed protein product [Meloidogyne enterolobii]|uniref:Uncharacterized protein n=1 Tax=Meloidogyne enterolobii TaxID=390850 RepID=A0ACB1AV11_MELEN